MAKLYPAASCQKRVRLRALAHLAEELESHLTNPERLSESQALRLSSAVQAGFGEVIRTALEESSTDNPQTQWQILLPILTEAETPPRLPAPHRPPPPRPDHPPRTNPRRLVPAFYG